MVCIAAVISTVSFLTYFANRTTTTTTAPSLIVEEFSSDRADLAGAPLDGGHHWEVDGGAFRVADGAVTASAPTFGTAFAIVRLDVEPTAVSVLFARISATSGLVFDFVDRSNYWSVEGAAEFGTWNVFQMHDGLKTFIANSGANLRSGSTVEVRRSDGRVEIVVDGVPVPASITDHWPPGSGVGLLAGHLEQGATMWSRFVVTGPRGDQLTSS